MRKNEDRKVAEQLFLNDRGRITNKEIAKKLSVHPATVARWKKLDEWDLKLLQTIQDPKHGLGESVPTNSLDQEELLTIDMKHLTMLNERIETYLQKKELLTSEILELAQAQYHILCCRQIIEELVESEEESREVRNFLD